MATPFSSLATPANYVLALAVPRQVSNQRHGEAQDGIVGQAAQDISMKKLMRGSRGSTTRTMEVRESVKRTLREALRFGGIR